MSFTTELQPGICAEPDAVTQDYVFNHTMLRVKDPQKSLDFYSRVLGMRLLRRLDFEEARFSLYFLAHTRGEQVPEDVSERQRYTFGRQSVSTDERRQRIRDVFDHIASRYDLMNDLMSFGIHRLWKRRFVAGLPDQGLFVDLAGGTGDVAALLARKPGRRVVVVDPSIPMMREGSTRADAATVRWIAGEAERLPFADGSVQALTVSFGLRNTTRLDVALA